MVTSLCFLRLPPLTFYGQLSLLLKVTSLNFLRSPLFGLKLTFLPVDAVFYILSCGHF